MAGNTGAFGLFGFRYEILPDRVTLTRPKWIWPVVLAFLVPAIIGWTQAFAKGTKHMDGSWFGVAAVCSMIVFAALWMSPLTKPNRIVVTREGVDWGGKKLPAQDIICVSATPTTLRARGGGGGYQSWGLSFPSRQKLGFHLDLGNRQLNADQKPIKDVGGAMANLLGKPLK